MTRLHFILIAVLVAGCSMKENEEEIDQGTFLGRHADALEGVDLSWRPDDEISINGHLYVTETGGKEARFIPDDKEVPSSLSYFATYPALSDPIGNPLSAS